VPTAPSSTDLAVVAPTESPVTAARRAVADLRHLIWFRVVTIRRPRTALVALLLTVATAVAVAVVPAFLEGAADTGASSRAREVLLLLPTATGAFLALAIVSSVASGGGRELLSRDQGVAYAVSPTTDHLGALLMSPLNIAWLLQAGALVGMTSYALGPKGLPAVLITLCWIAFATAVAQIVGWTMEGIRRTPHGVLIVRAIGVASLLMIAYVQASGQLTEVLNQLPTVGVVTAMQFITDGLWWSALPVILVLVIATIAAVVLGGFMAHLAAKLAPRDEERLESGHREAKPTPSSDLGMLLRLDRASVWRAVPMRRGMLVLAAGPGLVAFAGNLGWQDVIVLPGLVASGGALLFGVNIWCLDGRGGLWRESLPVDPSTVFLSKAWVLTEWLALGAVGTVLLASLRAGIPDPAQFSALICAIFCVVLQVVAAAMRWSAQRPYATDLRSARATPAPPVMMVAYSSRLAVSTTLTGMVFSGLARLDDWQLPIIAAGFFALWSGWRLFRARNRWVEPARRAGIVATVAG